MTFNLSTNTAAPLRPHENLLEKMGDQGTQCLTSSPNLTSLHKSNSQLVV